MAKRTSPKPKKRWGQAVAAAALTAVVVGLWLVKATPDAYRRTQATGPDRAAIERFNTRVVNPVTNVLLDKSGGTRLDVTIDEEMANARLALFLEEKEAQGSALPPVLKRLRVAFEPGSVVLATRVGSGVSSAVVSQHVALSVTAEGRLQAKTVGLRAGLAPMPTRLAAHVGRAVREHVEQWAASAAEASEVDLLRVVLDALDGRPVALEGRKAGIRLEQISLERGRMRVRGRRVEVAR